MHRKTRQEMVKTSLYMEKAEFAKIARLSGDISLNLFVMRAVRRAIADAEAEQNERKKVLKGLNGVQPSPTAALTVDSGGTRING